MKPVVVSVNTQSFLKFQKLKSITPLQFEYKLLKFQRLRIRSALINNKMQLKIITMYVASNWLQDEVI